MTDSRVGECLTPWLLCIHNIPPKPPYLRAKAARRLAALGAVAVKNAVYVLPNGERQRDGLVWLSREIEQGGGRAYVCGASFDVTGGGLDDAHIRNLFVEAREADYRAMVAEYKPLFEALGEPHGADEVKIKETQGWISQLRVRFETIQTIDYFGAPGREALEGLLAGAGRWLRLNALDGRPDNAPLDSGFYQGRTWVTRPRVHVDRIASAWLIRRFIDAAAKFRFDVKVRTSDDIRFDMAEAEFTHEGEACTFEVMARRFGLSDDPGLGAMMEVIHDIDLDEALPARPESAGLSALLAGICLRTDNDLERLEQGGRLLDNLYEYFERGAKRKSKDQA